MMQRLIQGVASVATLHATARHAGGTYAGLTLIALVLVPFAIVTVLVDWTPGEAGQF
ncbi:hypothetical protein QDR37_03580 [Amnibacterium sp. CER49]|uniref:hypothetical protein n=1 Tax=Amnibacterium sp. CER49 TaxID=3039161 RepID=UPI0024476D55|nr:hypothetical protein [Amnibacterium sp. CER49]MDH2443021.1 hypothetical protein [Amnibacterium sp. CER49]